VCASESVESNLQLVEGGMSWRYFVNKETNLGLYSTLRTEQVWATKRRTPIHQLSEFTEY